MAFGTDHRQFKSMNRREWLKLTPVIALGAFAIPKFETPLLRAGLGFSDWISGAIFRGGHLAPTFSDAELTPFNRFPINDYDLDDPGIDLEHWRLTVADAVQKPGDYSLGQIQTLPKITQNTRHVCVEGWDVIGKFWWSTAFGSSENESVSAALAPRFRKKICCIGRRHLQSVAGSVGPCNGT